MEQSTNLTLLKSQTVSKQDMTQEYQISNKTERCTCIKNIPCQTSRVSGGGQFVGSDDLRLINVGIDISGSVLSRYYKGIEGDHSNAIIVEVQT